MATVGLPLPGVSTSQLPTSNAAGNNQYSPPLQGLPPATPVFSSFTPSGGMQTTNPYLSVPATGAIGGQPAGSIYNPASSQSSGQTDISKQLIDIYGKGVGGSLNYLLQNMSGTDSAIFQQYLSSMQPAIAQQKAALAQGLGAMGISGDSSVQGIAQSNLAAQIAAQESGVNANLMQQQLQDTMSILTGAAPSAQKEVAQSGWTDFANVMANITGDVGALFGGPGPSPASIPGNVPQSFAAPQLTNLAPEMGQAPGNLTGYGLPSGDPSTSAIMAAFG